MSTLVHTTWSPVNMPSLPPELLLSILEFAIPPDAFLDSTVHSAPTTSWAYILRLKKTLLSVCKAWWSLFIPSLYHDIVLQGPNQILALARTIRHGHFDVAPLIKRIHLQCFLPFEQARIAFHELEYILHQAVGLGALIVGHQFMTTYSSESKGYQEKPVGVIKSLSLRLTKLEYRYDPVDQVNIFKPLLAIEFSLTSVASFSQLVSLAVPLSSQLATGLSRARRPSIAIQLHRLKELHVFCHMDAEFDVFDSWEMPCLKQLILTLHARLSLFDEENTMYQSFLMQHGGGIEYLDMSVTTRHTDFHHLWRSLDLCPKLRHFVIAIITVGVDALLMASLQHPVAHPSLLYVDIWADLEDDCFNLDFATRFLQQVRFFHVDLAHLLHLPRLFHPSMQLAEGEVLTHTLPTFRISQTRRRISIDYPIYTDDDPEDEDYVTDSDDSSDSDDESDVDDEDAEDDMYSLAGHSPSVRRNIFMIDPERGKIWYLS
ncbi:hypothetical protein OBBRIDRAFT_885961 [Obba rivulosa]|uniref:F-box domain-containing protein n=1 Tax=Obba rivulosa TaxID=1052685 RepID=A0A8E2DMY4_9APHY|nr:hypothetical protein OBBRIDRAFT_885961 [Obba rivulosa]